MRLNGDLSGVSAAHAAQLLKDFGAVIEGELKRYGGVTLQGLDYDDLRAIAHIAMLEAVLSHEKDRGGLKGWIRRTIRWRLAETVKQSQPKEELTDEPEKFPNGANPYQVMEKFETVMWVRQAIGVLDPRRRTIVVATMDGETLRQIGPTLGISKSRVGQERDRAFETLRQQALEDGVADE